ncbi:MAG: magnetochrome domain-containing protein [Desulfamplus sp.]|nr:magnetochrome domain-containing protein [Desulfamplus sp.]
MKNNIEYEFCMSQFKMAIVGITVLLVIVLGWTGYHCTKNPHMRDFRMAAANQPMGPPINVNDKMLHPYWGNCNKCHITTGAGKPVSQVMAGPPISINDKMLHDYWGNCMLCHKVTDGFQPPANGGANNNGANANNAAQPAAFNQFSPKSLGLTLQPVTAALMRSMGLANEDGLLITAVDPNSPASAAGLKKGDEIIRIDKVRQETLNDFDRALSAAKAGSEIKMTIYTGKKQRSVFLKLPSLNSNGAMAAAATAPMTQNQIETLAEQLGVPKTEQAVTQALQAQKQAQGQNTQIVAAVAPMTQNQIETLAEQLGVPKTEQAVTQALQAQKQAQGQNTQVVAAVAPMTQNQIETLAEQLGVPKTEQAVTQALQAQQQGQTQQGQGQQTRVVANLNFGKVAVASTGPGIVYQISGQFENSPYFVVFDPTQNSYGVVTNPNVNDLFAQGVQTAQYMVDLRVSNVIAGSFTQDALNAFHVLMVNVYPGLTGSVKDVLNSYTAGYLIPLNVAPYSTMQPATMPSTQIVNPSPYPYSGGVNGSVQPQVLY